MIYKLDPANYELVRPLFCTLDFHLTSAAVLDGNNPGQVFVDDLTKPQSAFMFSPEGCYLAGNPHNGVFNHALSEALRRREIIDPQVEELWFICSPEGWQAQLAEWVHPSHPAAIARRHYVSRQLRYDWRAHIPAGFALHRLDESLLNRPSLSIPGHIKGWMENNWGSTESFLQRGLGFVTLYANAEGTAQLVAWSLADCRSGAACEIGIRTVPEYRRCGLATITAAAAVEYALSQGFSMVGWQCSEDNLGSIGTAEKVGFVMERAYTMYCVSLNREE